MSHDHDHTCALINPGMCGSVIYALTLMLVLLVPCCVDVYVSHVTASQVRTGKEKKIWTFWEIKHQKDSVTK